MKAFAFVAVSLFTTTFSRAQVGIGTTTPDTTAVLELSSTSKAIVIPRITAAAMNAIPNPPEGSMVYNATARRFFGYGGTGTSSVAISQGISQNPQGGGGSTIGQSFTVVAPGFFLSSIEVFYAGGSALMPLNMTVRAGSGLGGAPLATASATSGAFGSTGPMAFSFTGSPVFLPAGMYTLTVQSPNAGNWSLGAGGNVYGGGEFYVSPSQSFPGTDLYFVVRKSDAGWKQLDN